MDVGYRQRGSPDYLVFTKAVHRSAEILAYYPDRTSYELSMTDESFNLFLRFHQCEHQEEIERIVCSYKSAVWDLRTNEVKSVVLPQEQTLVPLITRRQPTYP